MRQKHDIDKFRTVQILDDLNKYLIYIADLYDKCCEKFVKTIYHTSNDKIKEVMQPIDEIREEREGKIIISKGVNGGKIKMVIINSSEELGKYNSNHLQT